MSETMIALQLLFLFSILHSSLGLQHIERVLRAILYKKFKPLYALHVYIMVSVDLLESIVNSVFNKNLKLKFRVTKTVPFVGCDVHVPLCQCWWGRTSLRFPLFLHPGLIPFCALNTSLIFLFFFLHGVIIYFLLFFLHLFFYLLIFVLFPTWKNSIKSELKGVWVQIC